MCIWTDIVKIRSSDSGSPAAEKVNDIGSDSQHGDISPNQGSLTRRFSLSWRDMMKVPEIILYWEKSEITKFFAIS